MANSVAGGRRSKKKIVIGASFAALTAVAVMGTSVLAHADTNGNKGTADCTFKITENGTVDAQQSFTEDFDSGAGTSGVSLNVADAIADDDAAEISSNCEVRRFINAPDAQVEIRIWATSLARNGTNCPPENGFLFDMTRQFPLTLQLNTASMVSELSEAQRLGCFIKMSGTEVKFIGTDRDKGQ
jgi:hypothetical protein